MEGTDQAWWGLHEYSSLVDSARSPIAAMKNVLQLILLSFALLMVLSSCERSTELRLEGGVPPRFLLSGSGRLGTVIFYGPEEERIADADPTDKTYAIWEIEPNGTFRRARVH